MMKIDADVLKRNIANLEQLVERNRYAAEQVKSVLAKSEGALEALRQLLTSLEKENEAPEEAAANG